MSVAEKHLTKIEQMSEHSQTYPNFYSVHKVESYKRTFLNKRQKVDETL